MTHIVSSFQLPDGARSRRAFLSDSSRALGAAAAFGLPPLPASRGAAQSEVPPSFPRNPADEVEAMVRAAHGDLPRVQALLGARPALAKATIDWGFGDWESAIEAASHVGHRPIAELLLANGARPTLLTHAMLGNLAVVRAAVEADRGALELRGPHSIALWDHARVGGDRARPVRDYLESLGVRPPVLAPLDPATRAALVGSYAFGAGASDRLVVSVDRDALQLERTGGTRRTLRAVAPLVFHPVGAEAVRVVFKMNGAHAGSLAIHEPAPVVVATRVG